MNDEMNEEMNWIEQQQHWTRTNKLIDVEKSLNSKQINKQIRKIDIIGWDVTGKWKGGMSSRRTRPVKKEKPTSGWNENKKKTIANNINECFIINATKWMKRTKSNGPRVENLLKRINLE